MKKLLLLSLTILLFSCGDSILWDDADPQPFRDIYKNTYWKYGNTIYTFDNNIIHKRANTESGKCWVTTEGSFDDASYSDSCTWDNVTRGIIMERDDIFVYRSVSTDAEDGDNCYSGETIHTFKVVGYNEIVWTDEWDDGDIYTQRLFRLEDGVTPPTYTDCESW